jgi:nucleotide-binding universal stress UspA family protein
MIRRILHPSDFSPASRAAFAKAIAPDGIVSDRIVRAAKTQHADLIVIGTHGRTGIARFVLGSVANRVVSHAGCPVLTVRGK